MKSGFIISDLGKPEDFLGMQIKYDHKKKTIKLWQEKYIVKTCKRYSIVAAIGMQ